MENCANTQFSDILGAIVGSSLCYPAETDSTDVYGTSSAYVSTVEKPWLDVYCDVRVGDDPAGQEVYAGHLEAGQVSTHKIFALKGSVSHLLLFV